MRKVNVMTMLNELLEELCKQRIELALDQALWESESYKTADDEAINKLNEALDLQNSKMQRLALDELVAAYNACSVEYAKVAYRQGFQDGIKLLYGLKDVLTEE